jgi:pyrroloquinoline-quinone synthase
MKGMTAEQFRERLLGIMDQKHHWAWPSFTQPGLSKDRLKIHFQQEYEVYVRDFPVYLARIHGWNPPADVRRLLAENIYEEDTGGLSVGRSHPELFLQMMRGLGYRNEDFSGIRLLPAARRYRRWLDTVSWDGHWVVSSAVLTIFVEGSIKDRDEITKPSPPKEHSEIEAAIAQHPLVRHYGAPPSAMDLIRAHQAVEAGHRHAAYDIVTGQDLSAARQREVIHAMEESLAHWLRYRDAVARACGLERLA